MKVSKEFKVGLMALVAMIALYFGFNFLKGSDFFSSTNYYYTTYNDIGGLTVSNPVKINGFVVGRVKEINLLPKENNKIKVTIEINDDITVAKNAKAILKDDGLLGGKMIELSVGNSKEVLKSGGNINAEVESNLMAQIQNEVPSMMKKVDSTLSQVNSLLAEFQGIGGKVGNTLDTYNELGRTVQGTLNENRRNLLGLTNNLQNLSASLVETEKSFKPVIGKMNTFADSLNALQLRETVEKTNQSIAQLQGILKKVDNGEGTLGALLNDDSLYNNLNTLSIDLDKLLIDLRKNPKRYVKISVF